MPSGTTETQTTNEYDSYSEFLKNPTKSLSIVNSCIMDSTANRNANFENLTL
jgi:hypothetical protein